MQILIQTLGAEVEGCLLGCYGSGINKTSQKSPAAWMVYR